METSQPPYTKLRTGTAHSVTIMLLSRRGKKNETKTMALGWAHVLLLDIRFFFFFFFPLPHPPAGIPFLRVHDWSWTGPPVRNRYGDVDFFFSLFTGGKTGEERSLAARHWLFCSPRVYRTSFYSKRQSGAARTRRGTSDTPQTNTRASRFGHFA